MLFNQEELRQLLLNPAESLNVETKTWIDPRLPEGKAKLVKAVFALRNRNGGTFVIGCNNETLQPDAYTLVDDVQQVFHVDTVQAVISKYASEPFEIKVHCLPREDVCHPLIVVPEGVRVPVIVRSDLPDERSGRNLLSEGDLYFRTLRSNGTPSSAKIKPSDYRDLLEICFENREADIGRFLRRHLGPRANEALLTTFVGPQEDPLLALKRRCAALMAKGDQAYDANTRENPISVPPWMPADPLTLRVALCLEPAKKSAYPTRDFLQAFASGNPRYTGWPIWLDSSRFTDPRARPKVKDGTWQALIVELDSEWPHSDFELLDPRGEFYLRRMMQDDLRLRSKDDPRLDVRLMLYRVAEVFAVGLAVAGTCGWREGTAGFELRWSGLAGRSLGAWANPLHWDLTGSGTAHDPEASSFTGISLDTPATALAPYVARAVAPLFAAFDGYIAPMTLIEECVRRLVERRMD